MNISLKTPLEIETIAEGGKILAGIMEELEQEVKPGVATADLDRLAESLILKYGGKCSFKDYETGPSEKFPACICASLNETIVHGIPSKKILASGDLLSIDLGLCFKGFHADMAETVGVGEVSGVAKKLLEVTQKSLWLGIKTIKPGKRFGDISAVIQKFSEKNGFNVVRDLCGHGIGRHLHEDPEILNYGKKGTGLKFVEGMVFCLEPMLSVGTGKIRRDPDGSYKTADNSLSCHFEHTIAVTKNGARVLTVL